MNRTIAILSVLVLTGCLGDIEHPEQRPAPGWAENQEEEILWEALNANCNCNYNGRDPDCTYVYAEAAGLCSTPEDSESSGWEPYYFHGTLYNDSSTDMMYAHCSLPTYWDEGYTNLEGMKMYGIDDNYYESLSLIVRENNLTLEANHSGLGSCAISVNSGNVYSCLTAELDQDETNVHWYVAVPYKDTAGNRSAVTGFRLCYSI